MTDNPVYTAFSDKDLQEIDKAVKIINKNERGVKYRRSDFIREASLSKLDKIKEQYPEHFNNN